MADKALRLYPAPAGGTDAEGIYQDLELPPAERGDDSSRPYVVINMVSSLDGRTAIEGKASRIGSETDRQVMRTLRSKADAVMVGANTLRAEKLSLGLDEPARSQPIALVLTTTGDLPLENHLIHHNRQRVLVLVPESCSEEAVRRLRRRVEVLLAPTSLDGSINLEETMKVLTTEHAVNLLLVEGGPTLNHALISRQLADELFLTLAPKLLLGATSHMILGTPAPAPIDLRLLSLHLAGSELFLRYAFLWPQKIP